jgi:hypothetical protein
MRRNEPTSKFENAVPAGLLFGPRFRLGLPISNWPLAVCVALRATLFPFDFVFKLAFCALRKEAGEGVTGNAPWSEVDGPELGLRNVEHEGWVCS